MRVYRIEITSWTAGFRYPNLISGFQPTLDVPPVSTVLGLINAAAGKYLEYSDFKLGYYFEYEAKAVDLETIYQIELKTTKSGSFPSNSAKSNVIKREFLFNCRLFIYLQDEYLAEYFRKPYYSLILGRSGDLATVKEIVDVELKENNNSDKVVGQVIPFSGHFLPGEIQALPKYFTDTIPRNSIGVEAYSVVSCYSKGATGQNIKTFRDNIYGNEIDIYFHRLDFNTAPTELP